VCEWNHCLFAKNNVVNCENIVDGWFLYITLCGYIYILLLSMSLSDDYVEVVASVVTNVVKVVSCCRCRWSCWSLLHLLLSPRIIIHIKLGGLMPCWMYKHSYKVRGLMPCWMLDHSYHVESQCSISWESMLYKLGA